MRETQGRGEGRGRVPMVLSALVGAVTGGCLMVACVAGNHFLGGPLPPLLVRLVAALVTAPTALACEVLTYRLLCPPRRTPKLAGVYWLLPEEKSQAWPVGRSYLLSRNSLPHD